MNIVSPVGTLRFDSIVLVQCIPEKCDDTSIESISNREFDCVLVCCCFVSVAVVHLLPASESPWKALLS